MSITATPCLSFACNTREAFAFYAQALGATIETMMSYDDMPAIPEGGGCGDGGAPPGMPFTGMNGEMIALQYDTVDQAHSAFHALAQGGQVPMPLAPAFWAQTLA